MWRKVTEDMPRKHEWVLVIGKTKTGGWWQYAGIGQWTGSEWDQDAGQVLHDLADFIPDDPFIAPYENVTHWQPLPPMPEEEK